MHAAAELDAGMHRAWGTPSSLTQTQYSSDSRVYEMASFGRLCAGSTVRVAGPLMAELKAVHMRRCSTGR